MKRAVGLDGIAIGLAVGLPLLLVALLVPGRYVLGITVPVLDTAAVLCLGVTALIALVDAWVRTDRGSLPLGAIAIALAVLWLVHLATFPGDLPNLDPQIASAATSSVFLATHVCTPLLLLAALLQRGSRVANRARAVTGAAAIGLLGGASIAALAVWIAPAAPTITGGGRFTGLSAGLGGAGLVPALVGLGVYLAGHRGDDRASGGMAAALVLSACNAIVLLVLDERYTISWYIDHLLSFLPAVALLAGQVWVVAATLHREQRAAATLRSSLEMAEAMAGQVELGPLVERLMVEALGAVQADRVTLMAVDGDQLEIRASIDRSGSAARPGHRLSMDSLQVKGVPIVEMAIAERRAIATEAYDRSLLDPQHAAGVVGLRHYITWPLLLGGSVDAVLFLSRRRDQPFRDEDSELLTEFATMAALLLRNAQLLRAAEGASVTKSNFLNLAAHELRTPVSVIRGYVDLLAAGDLGPVGDLHRGALHALQDKAQELAQQVEQLLTAARLDAGQDAGAGAIKSFDLGAAASAAVARASARARLLDATIELERNGVVAAVGNPAHVGLVLDNLINNALTYSRERPSVRIEVAADGGPLVRVADHGIGISSAQQDRVFDPFHRVDRPDFGFPSGTGLGLSIARRLAEAGGGSLELEWSEPEAGSRFVLRLRPSSPGS